MNAESSFLFASCQAGAEAALKAEVARKWPGFRLAYSRPGFVTFKFSDDAAPEPDFDLRSTFARSYGLSLGRIDGTCAETMAAELWRLAGDRTFDDLHVWQRDRAAPGERGFEPGRTALADDIGRIIAAARPKPDAATQAAAALLSDESSSGTEGSSEPGSSVSGSAAPGSATPGSATPGVAAADAERHPLRINAKSKPGRHVLDCVLVEPNEWWVGWHKAASLPSRWPGGVYPLREPPTMITRAYRKMAEALAWSQLPIAPGHHCAELGCAPGGASQALLERGLHVLGIDPADMHEEILADPNFVHFRMRAMDVKRREFAGTRWLFADANVAPQHTLDAVGSIVTHADVHIRGLVLMLKLPDWSLAESISSYVDQVRSWGYAYVRTRQLSFNRQEICLAALRTRSMRRLRRARG